MPVSGLSGARADEPAGEPTRLIVGFSPRNVGSAVAEEAHDEAGGDVIERSRVAGIEVVEVDDAAEAIEAYDDQPGVRYVEVDRRVKAFTNDPYYSQQWNLQPLSDSNKGSANVEPAWGRSLGREVVVAVVDTGVKKGGTDLDAARVLQGKDFVNGDDDADDDNGHGTHVAGTIAQSTDNGRGVAGVAPDARILPVKVLDSFGAGFLSDIVEGIAWADSQGADVINMSLGLYEYSDALCQAVWTAYQDTVVVAATGNDGAGLVSYPAACPGALAVGAVRYDGQRTEYSNYGVEMALLAPGGDMTVDQNGDGYGDGILQQTYEASWGYRFYEGTSMASPHVAGVAALVIGADPDAWKYAEKILTQSARDVGDPGWDEESGFGIVDATAAVDLAVQWSDGAGEGYWIATEAGQVRAFGAAQGLGSSASRGSKAKLVAVEETPSGNGYWLLDVDGGVHAFGDAAYKGSLTELKAQGKAPAGVEAIDISSTPSGQGYWVLDAVGGIFTFGDAIFYGSVPGLRATGTQIGSEPVVDLASTPTGRGYWLLDRAGGMFAFGDASYYGSVPGLRAEGKSIGPAEIVGMAPTADGFGYWLVDSAGGMFAFGSAPFYGSIPGLRAAGTNVGAVTVVAMEPTASGAGYWIVDDRGGVFTFGVAPYHGSLPDSGVRGKAVGIAPSYKS